MLATMRFDDLGVLGSEVQGFEDVRGAMDCHGSETCLILCPSRDTTHDVCNQGRILLS